MENKNEPLIFIDTASCVKGENKQLTYDSRFPDYKKTSIDTLSKIDSVVALQNENNLIVCSFEIYQKIEGIPMYRDDQYLYIKQNGEEVKYKLNEIKNLSILKM